MIRLLFVLVLFIMIIAIAYAMSKKVTFRGLPVKYTGFIMYASLLVLLYMMFTELGKIRF